jgi:hypothetical protein
MKDEKHQRKGLCPHDRATGMGILSGLEYLEEQANGGLHILLGYILTSETVAM